MGNVIPIGVGNGGGDRTGGGSAERTLLTMIFDIEDPLRAAHDYVRVINGRLSKRGSIEAEDADALGRVAEDAMAALGISVALWEALHAKAVSERDAGRLK
jgi:hypothetical protein